MSDRPDMPMFTIKAKDALSVPAIEAYRRECLAHGLDDQAISVEKAIHEFRAWQRANIDLTKLPDHKHVPVSREAVAGRGDTS